MYEGCQPFGESNFVDSTKDFQYNTNYKDIYASRVKRLLETSDVIRTHETEFNFALAKSTAFNLNLHQCFKSPAKAFNDLAILVF